MRNYKRFSSNHSESCHRQWYGRCPSYSQPQSIRPRGKPLAMAVSAALAISLAHTAQADFPAIIQLSELDGTNGFKLDGEAAYDRSGYSARAAGDVNGDGLSDVIVGAFVADPNGDASGRSFVVFGRDVATDNGFSSPLQLSALDGTNGFTLDGEAEYDESGRAVSAAGDINGDGVDDLIVGAPDADTNGNHRSGRSYVIFGQSSGFAPSVQLSALDGANGFKLDGEAAGDISGYSVSAAGDVNGDGADDLIVSAVGADPNGIISGRSYVVFGRDVAIEGGFASPLQLSTLDGSNGFKLDGEASDDQSGASVSGAGDINGDGVDDLVVGAPFAANSNGECSGRTYVVFGRTGAAAFTDVIFANGFEDCS